MPKTTKMKPLSVRIPTPLYEDLQKKAKESGEKNFSEYIRKRLGTDTTVPTEKEIVYKDREVPVYKDRIIEKEVEVPIEKEVPVEIPVFVFLEKDKPINAMLRAHLSAKNPMLKAYLNRLGKDNL